MSLFRKSYLKKLRADLVKETGRDISDEAWNEVVENVEAPIRKKLQKELPKAIAFTICKIADKGDEIIEIDGINLGAKIHQLRKEKLEKINKMTERGNLYYCTECNRGHRKNSTIGLEHECYKFTRDKFEKKEVEKLRK